MKRRAFLSLLSTAAANLSIVAARPRSSAPAARFIAFGDTGTGDDAQYELARIMAAHHRESPFERVLLLGDNIYPDGDLADVVPKFERPYADLLQRGVKFHAVLGNHDVRKGRETQIQYPHFNMGGRAYYSFADEATSTEFFAIDSNDFNPAQKLWLERTLAASRARWKIAYLHHPVYSSGKKHGSNLRLRAELEPLLVTHGVTAVFAGHDHTYERSKLQRGVQHFVSGAGSKLRRGDLNRQSSILASGTDEASCFISVEITPDRFDFKTIDLNGRVIDQGQLESRATVPTQGI
ncbi:MAG TPA: metallophosphoesterase [Blastocatellia bacterium]|nr:metallophosphoesterase [Blastocatellia bacterium]